MFKNSKNPPSGPGSGFIAGVQVQQQPFKGYVCPRTVTGLFEGAKTLLFTTNPSEIFFLEPKASSFPVTFLACACDDTTINNIRVLCKNGKDKDTWHP